jgi:hypothetical protein
MATTKDSIHEVRTNISETPQVWTVKPRKEVRVAQHTAAKNRLQSNAVRFPNDFGSPQYQPLADAPRRFGWHNMQLRRRRRSGR